MSAADPSAPGDPEVPPEAEEARGAPSKDVLSEVAERAGLSGEDLATVRDWLAAHLAADRFAKLEQASHGVEGGVLLSRVLVDLQAGLDPGGSLGGRPFLAQMAQFRADRRLYVEGDLSEAHEPHPLGSVLHFRVKTPAYVLIGGPGQGKSTLSQALCQIHRAGLLRPHRDRVSPIARDVIDAFAAASPQAPEAAAHLSPAVLRLPLRVPLADASAWIASLPEGRDSSLLDFIAQRTPALGGPDPAGLLRRLTASMDVLLVLDGLDEVPAAQDRARLLRVIRIQLGELSPARTLVMATTRPQGYAGELDDIAGCATVTQYLVPFGRGAAIAYSSKLVPGRFPTEPERQGKLLERLTQAATSDATARLMRTPLQVTIMAALLDRLGRPPLGQWSLFQDYYRIVYDREVERPNVLAGLLREYRPYVDKVHRHVGLLLQVLSEAGGGGASSISKTDLMLLLDEMLAADGMDAARRTTLVNGLRAAIEERLVLLVEGQVDRLSFEVRAIQEHMAAWALADGPDTDVKARLDRIAPSSAFRQVLLFLASKAFTELSHLRDHLVDVVCPALNDSASEPLPGMTHGGALLAVQLLEEGSCLRQAKYAQKLAVLASEVVALPAGPHQRRLVDACLAEPEAHHDTLPPLRAAIERGLSAPTETEARGALNTLLALLQKNDAWAEAKADEFWEARSDLRTPLGTLAKQYRPAVPRWILRTLSVDPAELSAADLLDLINPDDPDWEGLREPWLSLARLYASGSRLERTLMASGERWRELSFARCRLHLPEACALIEGRGGGAWWFWNAVAKFARDPSSRTLAEALRATAALDVSSRRTRGLQLVVPWPLLACLSTATTTGDLEDLAHRADAGELGDITMWTEAESTWQASPLSVEAIGPDTGAWPLAGSLAEAPPLILIADCIYRDEPIELVQRQFEAVHAAFHRAGWRTNRAGIAFALLDFIDAWTDHNGQSSPFSPLTVEEGVALQKAVMSAPLSPLAAVHAHAWAHASDDYMGDPPFAFEVWRDLATSLKARTSGLIEPHVWDQLHLPLPRPERRAPSVRPGPAEPDAPEPFIVESLTLTAVRGFDQFELTPAPPQEGFGQWIVLLGENGTGKTTLLRSLALGLGHIAPLGRAAAGMWRQLHPTGQTAPSVHIHSSTGAHQLRFAADPDGDPLLYWPEQLTNGSSAERPSLFGYGCRRGPVLGRGGGKPDDEPGGALRTLFGENTDLIDPETWLLLRQNEARETPGGPAAALFTATRDALARVLPAIEHVDGRDGRIWVKHESFGEVPLAALSDGYLTTAGWVIDLIARWIAVHRRKGIIEPNFLEKMTGLVLIDEIDLHLHPAWQQAIIKDVRRIFPRMSFVVTTHNPLTLLGARAEEIWRLSRDDDGHIVAEQGHKLPALLTAAQLLRTYFGVERLFPAGIGEKLQRYAYLTSNRARTDAEEAEMVGLAADLRAANVDPGWEPVPRSSNGARL